MKQALWMCWERKRERETRVDNARDGAGKKAPQDGAPRQLGSGAGAPRRGDRDRYAALDLGTNNCRLLVAAPRGRSLRIVDAFSRIVRLGEGVSRTNRLSDAAMERTIDALKVCAEKIARRRANYVRCIATEACRAADNGAEFLERVRAETGLEFEIISPEEEARLAVLGCSDLLDKKSKGGLIFDIGGGSTEISWVRPKPDAGPAEIAAWTSMPFGVVSLAERWGGHALSRPDYDALIARVREEIAKIGDPAGMAAMFGSGEAHLVGTSGTVTSVAGVYLGLTRYRRDAVDGLWLTGEDVRNVAEKLRAMTYEERAAEPCIGRERADLVMCGCAILEALLQEWPAQRVRVADRGLREGVLTGLAERAAMRRRKKRRRKKR